MGKSRDQLDRVDRARLVESGGARDDSASWNLGRAKQGDAIRVDSASSWCRRQVCKCGCFNHGNVISSERDDRLGSLEVSAVAVMGNLKKYCTIESEQDRSSRGPRNARGRRSDEESYVQTRQSRAEESGKVGKRDDAIQLRWNVSRKLV